MEKQSNFKILINEELQPVIIGQSECKFEPSQKWTYFLQVGRCAKCGKYACFNSYSKHVGENTVYMITCRSCNDLWGISWDDAKK